MGQKIRKNKKKLNQADKKIRRKNCSSEKLNCKLIELILIVSRS